MKSCGHCKQILPLDNFGLVHGKPRSTCNTCRSEYMLDWKKNNHDQWLATKRKSHHKNKEKNRDKDRNRRYLRRYGITSEEYDQFFIDAEYRCRVCGNEAKVLDHCHITFYNRGVLCNRCNLLIGQMEDSPLLLRAAADYLEAGSKAARKNQRDEA